MPDDITWVLEPDVFGDADGRFREAVLSSGQGLVTWKDAWWTSETWPRLELREVGDEMCGRATFVTDAAIHLGNELGVRQARGKVDLHAA